MSNIIQIHPTRRVVGIAHRVTLDLVPRAVLEKLFYAAIAVGWSADDEAYSSDDKHATEHMEMLQKAVTAASQYTIPVKYEAEEPAQ